MTESEYDNYLEQEVREGIKMAKKATKKAKKKTSKRKPKFSGLISQWAVKHHGTPGNMCDGGREVYDEIVALEEKGWSAKRIVTFFEKENPNAVYEFVTAVVEGQNDTSNEIGDLEDALQSVQTVRDSYGNDKFSKDFLKAVTAEEKRLDKAFEAANEAVNTDGTPVFSLKDGKVVVTFKA